MHNSELQLFAVGEFRSHQGHDSGDGEPTVKVHTGTNLKRKRRGGRTVSIVTEPEDMLYRISFFNKRRLSDNSPSRSGINWEGD